MQQFIQQANQHLNNTAIIDNNGNYTYQQLLQASAALAVLLLNNEPDLKEQRVAFMVNPGFDYVKTQWAIWRAGGIAVPLCLSHPLPSLQYVIDDTAASILIVSPQYESLLNATAVEKNIRCIVLQPNNSTTETALPLITAERRAMILYTSGTTNLPKGVVTTHANLQAQIIALVNAWQWSSADKIVCILPLHHVHGIVNVVSCALWSGASCRFLPEFNAAALFSLFKSGVLSLFMAVPTIYFKLISHYEALPLTEQQALTTAMQQFRLMVSGSAALPVTVMEKWKLISGHSLLERYGMTEIGMAISNPYIGERKAGYVGLPLPGVQIRLADENYNDAPANEPGEILVKGDNVFNEYWNKPEATKKEFTTDGWFKTGDMAVVENGYYRIMGRSSVDIIKSGGYKISALEIEEVLRTHPQIKDCAVVGLENEEWGELVAAALVTNNNEAIDTASLNAWIRERMPAYRVPRKYLIVAELPRNAMGKVTKNDVKKMF
ncbi:MAG: long-chain fatty acid--CoA ligase [Sphingobacteriales bacterium]|nr:MAG: long-chain fatty acid--CoA ligase [Sphingobacteriales bacterium]